MAWPVSMIKRLLNGCNKPQITSNLNQTNATSKPLITKKATATYQPHPKYPYLAKKRRWQGQVLLLISLDEQGNIINIKIEQSSGFTLLDKTAIKTIRQWQFEPAYAQNKAIRSQLRVPIKYQLR